MKKRKRENRFSATFVIDGKDVVVDLPIEDYPTMFSLLEFDPPGLLVGRPRDASGVAGVWCVPVNFSDKKLRDSGWDSGVSASIDVTRFGQFLAKIAHCISVSRYGDSFFPIQDVFIRYPTNSTMRKIDLFHTIGGMPASISPSPWLHQVGWATIEANGIGYILISIRFFAYLGAPLYLVVSGQLKTMPKPHELSPFFLSSSRIVAHDIASAWVLSVALTGPPAARAQPAATAGSARLMALVPQPPVAAAIARPGPPPPLEQRARGVTPRS
jgi:hypothetical protein